MKSHKSRFHAFVAVTLALAIPSLAAAGKPERDRQKELEPKVAETKTAVKKLCGCDIPVSVQYESYPKADDMLRVPDALSSLVEALQNDCDDANEKAILCKNLKGYVVKFGKGGTDVSFSSGVISCPSTDTGYCGKEQVDKITQAFN